MCMSSTERGRDRWTAGRGSRAASLRPALPPLARSSFTVVVCFGFFKNPVIPASQFTAKSKAEWKLCVPSSFFFKDS